MDHAEGDGLGLVHKQAQSGADEQQEQQTHQLGQHHAGQDAERRALFGPVVLLGAQILADKGGQGHGHTHDGQEHQALQPGVRAVAGHGVLAEGVDIALNHQVAHADHRVLDAGRQALGKHLGEDAGGKAQPAQVQAGIVLHPAHPPQAQQEADALGEDGGHCGPRHPPVEHGHK